ncbi:hypothetical protein BLFGPEAP_02323 [Candidatus Methanoperedenaceae archaeon GB50]|nr:hypothetical protein BLFGPEAP_02323 [Candidatus Methanoperedenaceae archaeon GB50]
MYLERPFFNLDLVLYFLDRLPSQKQIKKLIKKRIERLKEIAVWAEETKQRLLINKQSEQKVLIPEHLKELIEVEIRFTKKLQEHFISK